MEKDLRTALSSREEAECGSGALIPAVLAWDGFAPISLEYDDRYHSRAGALEEARHVFLNGNNLPEAWSKSRYFHIAELGFGAAINFLAVWLVWRRTRRPGQRLYFFSVEKHPLSNDDLSRAHGALDEPEARELSRRLRDALPLPVPGFHRIEFPDDELCLTVSYGEAGASLAGLNAKVNCWFFDGFAPRKNPEMWSCDLFRLACRASRPGATFATYSVASSVKNNLEHAGWTPEAVRGFAEKKEMLRGKLDDSAGLTEATGLAKPDGEVPAYAPGSPPVSRALIIGGGLAGACAAYSLARRGIEVILFEQDDRIATRASGNLAGVVMPYLSAKPDLMSRVYLSAYFHSLRRVQLLKERGAEISGEACGVIRLLTSGQLQGVASSLPSLGYPEELVRLVSEEVIETLSGLKTNTPGLYFPGGGWLNPPSYTAAHLQELPRFRLITNTKAASLKRLNGCWTALNESGALLAEAEVVVLANGHECRSFPEAHWLPLEKLRGQLAYLNEDAVSAKLRMPICYEGYITPALQGVHLLGATYDHDNHSEEANSTQQQELLRRVRERVVGLSAASLDIRAERVAFRTMSPDRIPLAGPLHVPELFEEAYKNANHGNYGARYPEDALVPNMYVTTGHGSRGLLSCPLAGEIIASYISGEPFPIEQELINALTPARFLARATKRGQLHALID